LAIVSLFSERLFQNHECFDLSCAELLEIKPAEAFSHEIFLHQRFAFRRDEGFWTASENGRLAYPHWPRGILGNSEPPAPAASLQAGSPAYVALPTGLVGELEMEGD
jgi:hypothetical protein